MDRQPLSGSKSALGNGAFQKRTAFDLAVIWTLSGCPNALLDFTVQVAL
jgi:hypothetical protein